MRHSHVYAPPPPFLFQSHSDYWLTRLRPLLNQHNKTNKQGKHTNKRKKQTKKQKSEPKKQTNKQKWQKKEKNIQTNLKKKKKTRHLLLHSLSVFLDKSSLVWWDLKNWLSYRLTFVQHTFKIIVRLYKLFSAVYIWEKILNGSKMS